MTVVGTGGDKLIYMQALNREDFDRWVKIFVERTGLPVFDANQQVMPKYKSKGKGVAHASQCSSRDSAFAVN